MPRTDTPARPVPRAEIDRLLDTYRDAVHQNGRVAGADSVSAYHEMDTVDEDTPRRELLAALDALERDAARLDAMENDLDAIAYLRPPYHPDGQLVQLDWFVGDGDGHAVTTGPTIRAAADDYLALLATGAPPDAR